MISEEKEFKFEKDSISVSTDSSNGYKVTRQPVDCKVNIYDHFVV